MKYFTSPILILHEIYSYRKIIFELAKNDFKSKYLGSYFGILWAFIHPTIMILIYWFVFQVGFKSTPIKNYPFVIWLLAGIIPWFFFAESFSNATYSILDNSYLVKKIVFKVDVLPFVKIISSLFIHVFFILITLIMLLVYGYKPSIYQLQIIYYLLANIILVSGLSYLTSALVLFFKDIIQIVNMLLQFGFWLTPVFWSTNILPKTYLVLFKLNPLYYIVEGYRNSLVYNKWFWQEKNITVYFWITTICIFILGYIIFKKLRPHFSDVL